MTSDTLANGHESFEYDREFFELQFAFVDVLEKEMALSFPDILFGGTCLYHVLGYPVGTNGSGDERNPEWRAFAAGFPSERDAWSDYVWKSYEQRRAAGLLPDTAGLRYTFDADGITAALHFESHGQTWLARAELLACLDSLKRAAPHIRRVRMRSWLLGTQAADRVLPRVLLDRAVGVDDLASDALELWGQFVTSDGQVRRRVASVMRERVAAYMRRPEPVVDFLDFFPIRARELVVVLDELRDGLVRM